MELHFKHVKAEDAELLRLTGELDAYFLEKYDDLTKRYQKHHRLDAMDCRMLALYGEQAVGCGGWQHLDAHTAEIKRVYVEPGQRRQGVAWTLMRVVENDARRQGCTRAVLEAGAEEYGALAFYQSCGYGFCQAFGEFAGDENCVCMEKSLI